MCFYKVYAKAVQVQLLIKEKRSSKLWGQAGQVLWLRAGLLKGCSIRDLADDLGTRLASQNFPCVHVKLSVRPAPPPALHPDGLLLESSAPKNALVECYRGNMGTGFV